MGVLEKVTQCDCVDNLNEKLGPDHMLNVGMFTDQAAISLIRKDKWTRETRRGKVNFVVANYCPFCGTKYKSNG